MRRSGADCACDFFSVGRQEAAAPGAASADRAGVRISFAGRSAVPRRGRCGPALLRRALRCSCRAVACGGRGVSSDSGPRPLVRRRWHRGLRCFSTAHAKDAFPGRLGRRDSVGFDQGHSCPVVPRESSDGLAKPPRSGRWSMPPIKAAAHPAIRPRRPAERRGESVPDAGASPRRTPECASIPEAAPRRRWPCLTAAPFMQDFRLPSGLPVCRRSRRPCRARAARKWR